MNTPSECLRYVLILPVFLSSFLSSYRWRTQLRVDNSHVRDEEIVAGMVNAGMSQWIGLTKRVGRRGVEQHAA